MSEKMFKVKPDIEHDYFYLVAGENEVLIDSSNVRKRMQEMTAILNTAADAWKARENEDLRQEIAEQKDYIEQLLKEIKLQRESSKHPF